MSTDATADDGRTYGRTAAAIGRRVGDGPVGARLRAWYLTVDPRYRPVTVGTWALALVVYVLGDTGLTTVVLALGGFEANPIARTFLAHLGYAGLVVQKGLAVALLVGIWRYYPTVGGRSRDPWRLVVPTVAAARGLQLVAIHVSNVFVLL
jgi:GNAT superfamily N-acetyltransferase